jgi:hypothetical protein
LGDRALGRHQGGDFCRTATPICTENYFNDGSAPNDGWLLRDPAGHYHDPHGAKIETAERALEYLKSGCARRLKAARSGSGKEGSPRWKVLKGA